MKKHKQTVCFVFAAALVAALFCLVSRAEAQSTDVLRAKILENSKKIEEIQRQIDQYSTLLNSTSKEARTLKSALSSLELTRKKLEADLRLTSTQITKTALTLEDLDDDIEVAEEKIASTSEAMAVNIRNMQMAEEETVLEELLANKSISAAWDYINALRTIEGKVKLALTNLRETRMELGAKKDQAQGEKVKLESYKKALTDKSKVVELSKAEKDKLLKDTQNKESNYKALLDQKIAEREAFEKELFEYESKLKVTVDPAAIPGARSGVLSWPLDSVSVTQYFGKTVAAKRLYTSGSHGGIDFRASIGTKVKAAQSGTVVDTEAVRAKSGCQYGKWVLIRHGNGLTTIYGHLSLVSVSPGDVVITGDTIGYSGDTGYATGPHLHFGVYASGDVRVVDSSSLGSRKCAGIKTVAAPTSAYLDPSSYLPRI
jgi:murein DD-endopeptidase MepM/ murein hydrolase activator NlpD